MGREVNDAAAQEAPARPFLAIFGPTMAVILGVSLWVQLASFTLRADAVPVSALARVLSLALPFVALLVGVWTRSAVAVLALFPMSLIPPLLLTPDGSAASFGDPWSAGRVCASLALYLSLASAWLSSGNIEAAPELEESVVHRGLGAEVRRHIYPRLIPLLLWWAVPTYAIFWDPAIVGTLTQSHGADARVAQLFASTAIFFGWAVVAYMWFIVPSLNLEYDRRQIVRDADALASETSAAIWRRILITALVSTAATALLLLVV